MGTKVHCFLSLSRCNLINGRISMVTDNPVRLHHCFHHKGNSTIDCSICPRLSTFSCISLLSMVDAGSLTGVGLCGGANGFKYSTNSARELGK